jgi:hypothetical protein
MLADEMIEVTQGTWGFLPIEADRRLTDGTIVHQITNDPAEFQAKAADQAIQAYPIKIIEDRGRGTLITNQGDQGKLLQFFAYGQKEIHVGVGSQNLGKRIEYWMTITIDPEPVEDPEVYLHAAYTIALERLSPIIPALANFGFDVQYRMRYFQNSLYIWHVPTVMFQDGYIRPLSEEPCPKDKWYTETGLMAFSFPVTEEHEFAELSSKICGRILGIEDQYVDPEVQGGKIVLLAEKQYGAQKPPNFLDRMQSRYLKQSQYNNRIIEAEKEIAAINADIPEFLSQMTLDPNDLVVIVTNACEEMKRDEIAYGGQLWMQQDRHMAVANPVILGEPNSREAAIISAVCEAVEWTHALEIPDAEDKRLGQRVIIYPKELTGLSQVISTGNPIVPDAIEDHSALYERILIKSEKFGRRPLFLSEDDPQIMNDPV